MGMASPGDPLKISAADWNDLLRMLADYRQRVRLPERSDPSINAAGVVVAVRNDSGSDRKAYENLRLEGNIVDDNYRVDWAHNGPIFVGKLPGDAALVGDTMTPFVVLLDPIPAGEVGRGVLVGATWAKLNLTSLSHTRARMTEDDPTKLASDSQGSAKILYCPAVEGEQLAIVQQSAPFKSDTKIYVKNDTNETMPVFAPVGIVNFASGDYPATGADWDGVLLGVKWTPHYWNSWGVVQEEIAPGETGEIVCDGHTFIRCWEDTPPLNEGYGVGNISHLGVVPNDQEVPGAGWTARFCERGPARIVTPVAVIANEQQDDDTYLAFVRLDSSPHWYGCRMSNVGNYVSANGGKPKLYGFGDLPTASIATNNTRCLTQYKSIAAGSVSFTLTPANHGFYSATVNEIIEGSPAIQATRESVLVSIRMSCELSVSPDASGNSVDTDEIIYCTLGLLMFNNAGVLQTFAFGKEWQSGDAREFRVQDWPTEIAEVSAAHHGKVSLALESPMVATAGYYYVPVVQVWSTANVGGVGAPAGNVELFNASFQYEEIVGRDVIYMT